METTDAAFTFQPPQAAWPCMNALAHEPPAGGDARQRRPRHPECVIYTDEQLVMTSGAALPATFSLLADLLAAPHSAARQPLVRSMLHAVGFEWLAYGTMRAHGRGWRPTSFLSTYAHPEWSEVYFLEGWHDVDSRLHAAPPSGLPIAWDLQDLRSLPLPASRATAHRSRASSHRWTPNSRRSRTSSAATTVRRRS